MQLRRADGSERSPSLCAYPQAAHYANGDPDKASSFVCRCGDAAVQPDDVAPAARASLRLCLNALATRLPAAQPRAPP